MGLMGLAGSAARVGDLVLAWAAIQGRILLIDEFSMSRVASVEGYRISVGVAEGNLSFFDRITCDLLRTHADRSRQRGKCCRRRLSNKIRTYRQRIGADDFSNERGTQRYIRAIGRCRRNATLN